MKKGVLSILIILAVIAAVPSNARGDAFNFYLRSGLVTDDSFSFSPLLWTIGANFDLNLGSMLFLSPDCDIIVYKFNFSPLWLTPAVTLNLNLSGLYAGAGVAKFVVLGSGYTLSSDFLVKFNAGFRAETFKLQVYTLSSFDHIFDDMIFGFTLGYGF